MLSPVEMPQLLSSSSKLPLSTSKVYVKISNVCENLRSHRISHILPYSTAICEAIFFVTISSSDTLYETLQEGTGSAACSKQQIMSHTV